MPEGVAEGVKKAFLKEVGGAIIDIIKRIGNQLKTELKSPVEKTLKAFHIPDAIKFFKEAGKAFKNKEAIKAYGNVLQGFATLGTGVFGVILSVLDAFGVVQPILDAFSGILEIIGGSLMEELMPALQEFIDVLFSPEMIEIWKLIGTTIGKFLATILQAVTKILTNPTFKKILETFVEIFNKVVTVIFTVLKPLLDWLGGLSASQLGAVIYAVLVGLAFLHGYLTGGPYGAALGAAYAAIAMVALAPLLTLQHGGLITTPTVALIGEAGPEAVIPLHEMTKTTELLPAEKETNDEIIWALEENGEKLDMIHNALIQRQKIRAIK